MRHRLVLASMFLVGCGAKSTVCGTGTIEVNGQCVLRCGAGTVEVDGGTCVAANLKRAGEPCSATGFACQDATTAVECVSSAWVGLPCRGPGGCNNTGATITCDMTGDLAGDHCASTAEGRGLCTTDAKAVLECRSGVLVKTSSCSSCTAVGGTITCTP